MSVKRQISTSVADLHSTASLTGGVKRFAFSPSIDSISTLSSTSSEDGLKANFLIPPTSETTEWNSLTEVIVSQKHDKKPVEKLVINAKIALSQVNEQDFDAKYELGQEIGKGGFSCVYQCHDRISDNIYAVKVIDMRPLRLRERFNPARLRREVDIMKRLKHPNIVQFIEVFESSDKLMMVMEYAPGPELFDVILSRKCFTEVDARPIFVQVTKALYYLHCMNIIHRDIKPENILILNKPDRNGLLIAKLLDFGLSKNAGTGSEAKTFVGTPCYLAPEVEYTSKGLGGTYGIAADCWSLGAVLYVMLVARFPEFELDMTGKIVVKLPPFLWDNVSSDAKDLIRSLMNSNPAARLTSAKALQHPWLERYALSSKDLSDIAVSCYDMGQSLQQEEQIAELEYSKYDAKHGDNMTSSGVKIHDQAMVIRNHDDPYSMPTSTSSSSNPIQLAPLLHLQRSIASCLDYAHMSYIDMPEVATQIRRGAVLCRLQVSESTNMLRKVEQTADAVLNLFPDLELAIEEGEPGLAADFFTVVKGWVGELSELVKSTQEANHASMMQIQAIVEQSTESIKQTHVNVTRNQMQKQLLQLLQHNQMQISQPTSDNPADVAAQLDNVHLDANQVMNLFMNLFGMANKVPAITNQANFYSQPGEELTDRISTMNSDLEHDYMVDADDSNMSFDTNRSNSLYDIDVSSPLLNYDNALVVNQSNKQPRSSRKPSHDDSTITADERIHVEPHSPVQSARDHLAEALHKLRHVDMILDQLGIFWAHTELVLDSLTKKGQHVEQFIGFSQKPKLMSRFRERIEEYKRFWESISIMCANYVNGIQQLTPYTTSTGKDM